MTGNLLSSQTDFSILNKTFLIISSSTGFENLKLYVNEQQSGIILSAIPASIFAKLYVKE